MIPLDRCGGRPSPGSVSLASFCAKGGPSAADSACTRVESYVPKSNGDGDGDGDGEGEGEGEG